MIGYITSEMLDTLIKLKVTHYSVARNFDKPNEHEISSVHFFDSNVRDDMGGFSEVAYYLPTMYDNGFNKIQRSNQIDTGLVEYSNPLETYRDHCRDKSN